MAVAIIRIDIASKSIPSQFKTGTGSGGNP